MYLGGVDIKEDYGNPFIKANNAQIKENKDKDNVDEENLENFTDKEQEEKTYNNRRLLDSKFIECSDIIGDRTKKTTDYYFQHIVYANKKYIIDYTKKEGIKRDTIYYYCKTHKSTTLSNEFTKKGYKKKLNLCNAKIIYEKREQKFYIFIDHSQKCIDIMIYYKL